MVVIVDNLEMKLAVNIFMNRSLSIIQAAEFRLKGDC